MASTQLPKFDPAEHAGNVYDSFVEFIEAFAYEYEAIAKPPPTGTTDVTAWTELDKRRQLLGRFASRNLQKDFEAETTATERVAITYSTTVDRLKARYLPTQNKTLRNFEFHKLRQQPLETFDVWVNRVKEEAKFCNFSCTSATCTVGDTMIRDQIVIGTSDNEIRKSALNNQWNLADLLSNGRKIEAATFGSERIKAESLGAVKKEPSNTANVNRTRPGKYSRKGGKGKTPKKCRNCSNTTCQGGEKCFAFGRECFACGGKNHMRGAEVCQKKGPRKKRSSKKTHRVKEGAKEESTTEEDESGSSSGEDTASVHRLSSCFNPARVVAHVRRTPNARPSCKKVSKKYQVSVLLKEKMVKMFADTGADISVIPKRLAKELDLPLVKTRMRIKPYGSKKKIRCVGYYVGPVRFGDEFANVGIYVVNGEVEPLLSGAASEALGILTFHGDCNVRRVPAADDPTSQVYINKFPSVFSGVGKMRDVKVKFHVDESVPPVARPMRHPPYHLEAQLNREIKKMEEAGVIEDHDGPAPWVSNLVLCPKPDGGLRVTVDMREPNKAILDTGLPIPRPEDIRKELVGCKYFTKLDFRTAFHQLELDESSRYLTVFHHDGKLKRHSRLTMGAKPASGELNKALRPLFNDLPAVHIIHDDLVIATTTNREHEEMVLLVLERIAAANLTLNPAKCIFKQKEIPFWGMIVCEAGVRPDPQKVQALRDATHPESKAELMSFLCMVQANSEFIPQLSKETVNMRKLTQRDVRFKWSDACQKEFDRVRGLLCESALLAFFDTDMPTYIIVDAHRSGLSAILAQGASLESARMVSCASRTTTPVERRYHQLDLEALSVDFGLRRFRQFIVGGPEVTVVTDHKPLVSIFKDTRKGSVRSDRIKLRHQDTSYRVIYSPGRRNMADFLSRHATPWDSLSDELKEETREFEKTVFFLNHSPYLEAVSVPNIIRETRKDRKLQKLVKFVKQGYIPKDAGPEWRRYRGILDTITVSDSGLILKGEKIILPMTLWHVAINKAHQGGHPGETRMKTRVRSHFWIEDLNSLVKEKVSACETCQRFTQKTTKEPMAAQKTTGSCWEEVSIDLFGPLPDKRHVLVMQDTASRFPAAKIVKGTAAKQVIDAVDEVYTAYGQPMRHRTDNGPPFSSEEFQRYSDENGVEHVLSYPYHPQGNPVETFMKPLGKALKAAFYNRDCAQEAVDNLLKAYRATPHPATGVSPGDMLFRNGYRSDFPPTTCPDEDFQAGVEKDREQKRQRIDALNNSTKRRASSFREGDSVLLKNMTKGRKFDPLYQEEAAEVVIVEKHGVVVKDSKGLLKRRHKDDVKPFVPHRTLATMGDDEPERLQPVADADAAAEEGSVEDAEELHGQAQEARAVPPLRRSGRSRNLPEHLLKDFEVYGMSKGSRGGK